MKRLRYLLLVLMFFPVLGFIGCGSQELVIDQAVWLYDIGQEIGHDDFSVNLINGDEYVLLDDYSSNDNFNSSKEGIYNIEIGYASLSAIASIVVIDFDRFNLYAGQSLGDIVLPENVYFENASKIYTATGKSRSEYIYQLYRDLEDGRLKIYYNISTIEDLRRQLQAHEVNYDGDKPKVLGKDKIRMKINRSPDMSDSCYLANYARLYTSEYGSHARRFRTVSI